MFYFKLSPDDTVVKYQALFLIENKKKNSKMLSALYILYK